MLKISKHLDSFCFWPAKIWKNKSVASQNFFLCRVQGHVLLFLAPKCYFSALKLGNNFAQNLFIILVVLSARWPYFALMQKRFWDFLFPASLSVDSGKEKIHRCKKYFTYPNPHYTMRETKNLKIFFASMQNKSI